MNNYFIWFTIDGDIPPELKSQYSEAIHAYLFKSGIKLKSKSNAFIYKSTDTANEIIEKIKSLSKENILAFVTELNTNYQGWLSTEQWEFIDG